jgi:hypothetical protein
MLPGMSNEALSVDYTSALALLTAKTHNDL